MKTKEELNALKEEVEALNTKFAALSDEELTQVSGGQSEPPLWEIRSRANTFANLFGDFTSLITDIRNRQELFNEFRDKMINIADTVLIEDPNAVFMFSFAIRKDGNDRILPYVYQSGTLTVRKW